MVALVQLPERPTKESLPPGNPLIDVVPAKSLAGHLLEAQHAATELVVETEIELGGGEEFETVFSVVLPPDVTSMTVPAEFIAQSDEFKYEILAREESFNQTAIESCFILAE